MDLVIMPKRLVFIATYTCGEGEWMVKLRSQRWRSMRVAGVGLQSNLSSLNLYIFHHSDVYILQSDMYIHMC